MIHAFDTEIAEAHGVAAAIVHQEILRWCKYNEKQENKEVFIDGQYWVYLSHKQMHKHITYFSERTIRRALDVLVDNNLLEKKNREGKNPNALIYRAKVLTEVTEPPMDKMDTPYGQNGHTPYGQNGHTEHKNLKHRNKTKNTLSEKPDGLSLVASLNGQLQHNGLDGMAAIEYFVERFRARELELRPRNLNLTDEKKWATKKKAWIADTLDVITKQDVTLDRLVQLHGRVLSDPGNGTFAYRDVIRSPGKYNDKMKNGMVFFDEVTNKYWGKK